MPARVGGNGSGCGGAVVGAGADFGARFFDFALLGRFAFFIPFFFPAGAPRFAFLDFFATFNIPIKTMPRRHSRIISQLTRTHRLADIRGLNRNAR